MKKKSACGNLSLGFTPQNFASGVLGKCQHIFGLCYKMLLNLCKVLNVVYLLRYSVTASNIEQLSCEPTRLL